MVGSMKWVLCSKNFCLRNESMEYFQICANDFTPHFYVCRSVNMSNILRGIQQALEAIRIEIEKADWQLRLEILQLMLSKSTSVVAGVRK